MRVRMCLGLVAAGIALEAIGDEAGSVVGHDAAQADIVLREVGRGLAKETACGDGLFVGHHGDKGHAGVVIDGDVEELPAGAAGFVLGVAGDAVAGLVDAGQLLDIDVQQVAGGRHVHSGWGQLGFEHADFVELQPGEDAADRGAAEAGGLGDLDAGLALTPQLLDAFSDRSPGCGAGTDADASSGRPARAKPSRDNGGPTWKHFAG